MRTYVYIDGVRLYIDALKGGPHKWLDVGELCKRLLPRNVILGVRYFAEGLPFPDAAQRQETYLRALTARGMSTHMVRRHRLTAELTAFLVVDALVHDYECAVLITNDAVYAEPIKLVREELHRSVGVICSAPHFSAPLFEAADFHRKLRQGVLADSQLPPVIDTATGQIHRPDEW